MMISSRGLMPREPMLFCRVLDGSFQRVMKSMDFISGGFTAGFARTGILTSSHRGMECHRRPTSSQACHHRPTRRSPDTSQAAQNARAEGKSLIGWFPNTPCVTKQSHLKSKSTEHACDCDLVTMLPRLAVEF